jgi:hypothetical protein
MVDFVYMKYNQCYHLLISSSVSDLSTKLGSLLNELTNLFPPWSEIEKPGIFA